MRNTKMFTIDLPNDKPTWKVPFKGDKNRIIHMVRMEERQKTLDLIANHQGWEESYDIYAEKLGLPKKYSK